jgi:hypothetical protein
VNVCNERNYRQANLARIAVMVADIHTTLFNAHNGTGDIPGDTDDYHLCIYMSHPGLDVVDGSVMLQTPAGTKLMQFHYLVEMSELRFHIERIALNLIQRERVFRTANRVREAA